MGGGMGREVVEEKEDEDDRSSSKWICLMSKNRKEADLLLILIWKKPFPRSFLIFWFDDVTSVCHLIEFFFSLRGRKVVEHCKES